MEQKKLSRPNKFGELFLFQISYVLPGEYGGWHLLEACTRHVSVHALLAECDQLLHNIIKKLSCFNPRTPCGVRLRPTLYIATQQSKSYFAPTSLKRPSLHGYSF